MITHDCTFCPPPLSSPVSVPDFPVARLLRFLSLGSVLGVEGLNLAGDTVLLLDLLLFWLSEAPWLSGPPIRLTGLLPLGESGLKGGGLNIGGGESTMSPSSIVGGKMVGFRKGDWEVGGVFW